MSSSANCMDPVTNNREQPCTGEAQHQLSLDMPLPSRSTVAEGGLRRHVQRRQGQNCCLD